LVQCPTLLIVGEDDSETLQTNRQAFDKLTSIKKFDVTPRTAHLSQESGSFAEVAYLANAWFQKYL
jgi:hypothetical protein